MNVKHLKPVVTDRMSELRDNFMIELFCLDCNRWRDGNE